MSLLEAPHQEAWGGGVSSPAMEKAPFWVLCQEARGEGIGVGKAPLGAPHQVAWGRGMSSPAMEKDLFWAPCSETPRGGLDS